MSNFRKYTNLVIDAMDEGSLDPRYVATSALGYMSEDEVKDMCAANDILLEEDEEEDEEEDDGTVYYVTGDYGLETQSHMFTNQSYNAALKVFQEETFQGDLGQFSTVELGFFGQQGKWLTMHSAK